MTLMCQIKIMMNTIFNLMPPSLKLKKKVYKMFMYLW